MDANNTSLMMDNPIRIGELSRRTGKSVRALHLYEEMGLLRPVERTKGGFRLYAPTAVTRVEWIARLQDAGFSLPQVQELLAGVLQQARMSRTAMDELRTRFSARLAETRDQLRRLAELEVELESSLTYLAGCKTCEPAYDHQHCASCSHNGHRDGEQPLLVAGLHRG